MKNKVFKLFSRKKDRQEPCDEDDLVKYDQTIENCKILYKNGYVGWACKNGWYDILMEMSYRIEALHLQFYNKYRVRAEITELKEKFGTIRLMIDVKIDRSRFKCFILRISKAIAEFLKTHIDYQFKTIYDSPYYKEHREKELTNVEYVKAKRSTVNCANVKVLERNGKMYEIAEYEHYAQSHQEPSRFKILYNIAEKLKTYASYLSYAHFKPSRKQEIIREYMKSEVDKIIKDVESKTYNTCEMCGAGIGNEWSPRCETTGWVSYMCQHCAEKQNSKYYKNGELWFEGKCIKSKRQLLEDRKKTIEEEKMSEIEFEKEEAEYQKQLEEAERKDNEDKK